MTTSAPARQFSRLDVQWCYRCEQMREGRWCGHRNHVMYFRCASCGSLDDDE